MTPALAALAEAYGVETSYIDVHGRSVAARPEPLLRVLAALGAPVERESDAPDALADHHTRWCQRIAPRSVVLWPGQPAGVWLRVASGAAEASRVEVTLTLEGATEVYSETRYELAPLPVLGSCEVGGRSYVERLLPLPAELPLGVHSLRLTLSDGRRSTVRLFVPPHAVVPPAVALDAEAAWGGFVPLYGVRRERGVGAGNLGDLVELGERLARLGGHVVATLPLGPAFLGREGPYEPSPYAPLSRRYWNELYVDLTAAPGFSECEAARRAAERPADDGPLVDYQAAWERQLAALDDLARRFFTAGGESRPDFQAFRQRCPDAGCYAAFRARVDDTGSSWWTWSEAERERLRWPAEPRLGERARTYLFAQYCLDRDLSRLSETSCLYLDLPLGVAPDGYDALRAPNSYALEVSLGAPPDLLFTSGQTWGLPPLLPEHGLETGLSELRQVLAAQMRFASVLRVDHVMGLHRQFWVPNGLTAADGVYVRMPADELWAVHCLESHRQRCAVVGEDLGTVPPEVRQRMRVHGALRMYVVQNEVLEHPEEPWREPDGHALVALNTHDMPPFAAFESGADVDSRVALGLVGEGDAEGERSERERVVSALERELVDDPERSLHDAVLLKLASSEAPLLLVNLEDLWGEQEPQNVPGTWRERPNWRRRLARGLHVIEDDPRVRSLLEAVEAQRERDDHERH